MVEELERMQQDWDTAQRELAEARGQTTPEAHSIATSLQLELNEMAPKLAAAKARAAEAERAAKAAEWEAGVKLATQAVKDLAVRAAAVEAACAQAFAALERFEAKRADCYAAVGVLEPKRRLGWDHPLIMSDLPAALSRWILTGAAAANPGANAMGPVAIAALLETFVPHN